MKSTDAEKKSKNIVAVLPKVLVGKFFHNSLTLEDSTFQGLVVDCLEEELASLPIISALFEHLTFKDQIPSSNTAFADPEHQSFLGFVSQADRKGVTVRFLNGLKKLILVKDLETVQDFQDIYRPGKVVRCSKNKLDRLTLKLNVIYHKEREQTTLAKDKECQVKALFEEIKQQHSHYDLKVGEKVAAQVTLAKDYGNIVSVDKYAGLTGFILSE